MNNSTANYSLEYREYILPDEFPVLVLSPKNVQSSNPTDDNQTKYHFHNCIEIGICHSGEHNLLFENSVYKVSPGMFFVLSPYTMHYMNRDNIIADNDCEYLYIKPEELLQGFYPFEIPAEMLWYKNSSVPFIFSKNTHTIIYELLMQILNEFKEQQPGYKLVIKGLHLSLMAELTRILSQNSLLSPAASDTDTHTAAKGLSKATHSAKYQNMSKILPALRYIHQNFTSQPKTAELAQLCHMSTSGFCTLFSDLMNASPNRYISKLRLKNACELLHSTELPVLDISIESGFSSLSNFYRMFKEIYGMSPLKWRNQKRAIRKKNYSYAPFSPEV